MLLPCTRMGMKMNLNKTKLRSTRASTRARVRRGRRPTKALPHQEVTSRGGFFVTALVSPKQEGEQVAKILRGQPALQAFRHFLEKMRLNALHETERNATRFWTACPQGHVSSCSSEFPSPLALSHPVQARKSGRGLPQSKTLSRCATAGGDFM